IEQGEELYNQPKNPVPTRKRRQALEMLMVAAATPSQAKWILSLRTDYFGRLCHDLPPGAEAVLREYLLGPLNDEDLLEAVLLPPAAEPVPFADEAPFAKYGFTFEEGVAQKIVTDAQQAARKSHVSVLPLLQVVCAGLVENVQTRQDKVIHHTDLTDLG